MMLEDRKVRSGWWKTKFQNSEKVRWTLEWVKGAEKGNVSLRKDCGKLKEQKKKKPRVWLILVSRVKKHLLSQPLTFNY